MKRWLLLLPILVAVVAVGRAQFPTPQPGDLGPGEGGATLKLPGADPSPPQGKIPTAPAGGPPAPWNGATPFTPLSPTPGSVRVALPPSNQVDINKDIEITEKQAPWVIYAMSYSGPEAPKLAREFAMEMRNNPRLKLNAYVYNYGAKEKLREYQRVEELRKTQLEALQKAGVKGEVMPLRVRTMKIDEQTAVLIDGGYRTREEALAALQQLRKLTTDKTFSEEFVKRVKLDLKVAILEEADKKAKAGVRIGEAEVVVVNPFTRAFPARNPAYPQEQTAQIDEKDVKLMRKLNEDEPFSLFKSKKPMTLVIKQYNTQQVMTKNKKEDDTFLARFRQGLTLKNGEWQDDAAVNAHNLCDAFRKSGLAETYVLHAKYCSFVTVGGYESLEDPRLIQMQNFLESRFQHEAYRPFELMPRPAPMAVPQ